MKDLEHLGLNTEATKNAVNHSLRGLREFYILYKFYPAHPAIHRNHLTGNPASLIRQEEGG